MATQVRTRKRNSMRMVLYKGLDKLPENLGIRRCTLVSLGLILAGFSIPLLMTLHLLPVTFTLSFIGLVLVATGGVIRLVFCGEL